MSIDINGIPPSKAASTTDDSQVKQTLEQTATEQESGKSSSADTVSLSDNAVQLGKLDSASASTPVVDTQRVEQVKQAIKDGSYEVDPAKIADKLMQFEIILKPKG